MGNKKKPEDCEPTPRAKFGGVSDSESSLGDAGSSVPSTKGSVGWGVYSSAKAKRCLPGRIGTFLGPENGATRPREVNSKKKKCKRTLSAEAGEGSESGLPPGDAGISISPTKGSVGRTVTTLPKKPRLWGR